MILPEGGTEGKEGKEDQMVYGPTVTSSVYQGYDTLSGVENVVP